MSLADDANKSGVTVFAGEMLVEAALLKSVADLSAFLDRVQGCARVVWPHVVFPGEEGFDEVEEEAAPLVKGEERKAMAELSHRVIVDDAREAKPRHDLAAQVKELGADSLLPPDGPKRGAEAPKVAVFAGGAPTEGSDSDLVWKAARKLKTDVALPIANHLGRKPVSVGICLSKLRRAGLLA